MPRPFALLWLPLIAACQPKLEGPTPTLEDVTPDLVCRDQLVTQVTVTGTNLAPVVNDALNDATLVLPDLQLTLQTSFDGATEPGTAFDLDEGPDGDVSWVSSSSMTFEVTPDLALATGIYDLTVTNPDGQTVTLAGAIGAVAEPVITELVPEAICVDAGDTVLTVNGAGFLVVGGTNPTVTIDADSYGAETVSGCQPLGIADAEVCTSLTITVPGGTYALGDHEVRVTNPEPAACTTSEPATLEITNPPTITSVEPDAMCDSGGVLTVEGTDFIDGAVVSVNGVPATTTTFVDDTTLEAEFGPTGLLPGFYDVTVTNPDGCSVTLADEIQIVAAPLLFYVDPPVVYSGLQIETTLYVSGVTGEITRVWIEETADGTITDLTYDASDPEQIKAVVPAGLDEGEYDVFIEQDDFCPSFLDTGLFVEADLTVAVAGVDPEFAWTDDWTPVNITATEPAPSGTVQFSDVPRVYLNPTSTSATATALSSVTYKDEILLSAVIPPGLAPDVYDVIVVNPDGSVGLLDGGLEVTALAPPSVTSVSPASIPASGDQAVTVYGSNFRTPTVDLSCVDPGTGAATAATATVVSSTDTTISTTVPTDVTGTGVCVIRVTNADGPWVEYSAMSITNPSQNLFDWEAGTSMTTARRAPAAVAGRATSASRFLYAIGGDDGSEAGALSSIEMAAVDKFGDLGSWEALPGALPEPRTLAGVAKIGRYVYLVGGHDGVGPVDTVWRAQVLDPLLAPRFDDLSIDYGTGAELGGGTWSYRIAALFDAADPKNPGGESLASDPVVVRLPAIDPRIVLTIGWEPVADAVGYRIYRTPTADTGSGTEEWLADVSGGTTVTYVDSGAATDPSRTPLPQGALGEWYPVASLPVALQSPAVAIAPDPADPSVTYIYAAGGYDGSTVHDAIYYLDVTEVDDHTQTVGSWATSAEVLPSGVLEAGAWTVDSSLHSIVAPGEVYVFFGGGRPDPTSTAGTVGDVVQGTVQAGGELGAFQSVGGFTPTRAGFGVASASNFLYLFGGQKAGASGGGASTAILTGGLLDNWNSLGTSMTDSRYLMGSAQESAVIFMVGGDNGSGATATTDQTNF